MWHSRYVVLLLPPFMQIHQMENSSRKRNHQISRSDTRHLTPPPNGITEWNGRERENLFRLLIKFCQIPSAKRGERAGGKILFSNVGEQLRSRGLKTFSIWCKTRNNRSHFLRSEDSMARTFPHHLTEKTATTKAATGSNTGRATLQFSHLSHHRHHRLPSLSSYPNCGINGTLSFLE